jgi:hypothetical protein
MKSPNSPALCLSISLQAVFDLMLHTTNCQRARGRNTGRTRTMGVGSFVWSAGHEFTEIFKPRPESRGGLSAELKTVPLSVMEEGNRSVSLYVLRSRGELLEQSSPWCSRDANDQRALRARFSEKRRSEEKCHFAMPREFTHVSIEGPPAGP